VLISPHVVGPASAFFPLADTADASRISTVYMREMAGPALETSYAA